MPFRPVEHSFELRGKRVGVIGAAASAAPIIRKVAKFAGSLTIFMRTCNWVIARADVSYSALRKALMRAPFVMRDANHAFIKKGGPWQT